MSQIPTHLRENVAPLVIYYYYYYFSLTTDVDSVSQNPLVPAVPQYWYNRIEVVRVHFVLLFAVCQFPFRLQTREKGWSLPMSNSVEGVRVYFVLLPAVC